MAEGRENRGVKITCANGLRGSALSRHRRRIWRISLALWVSVRKKLGACASGRADWGSCFSQIASGRRLPSSIPMRVKPSRA
jgi:hypothetical protein